MWPATPPVEKTADRPTLLMLGMGWFPATLGGLDRYYRSLFEQLPEARGIAIGPALDAPARIELVGHGGQPLARRLAGFWRAVQRADGGAEIVDAHFALYALAPLLLGGLRSLPSVFHFHGPWAQESRAAGRRSRAGFYARRTLERTALRRADAYVVLSGAFRRLLVERYRVDPWNIHVYPPGVDLDRFTAEGREAARSRLGLKPSAFVAICVRRLVPRMGIDNLLDAWERLEKLPEGSTLLLIGDGQLRAQLTDRATRPPLAGRVRVMGKVSDEELIDAYRCADVAIVPSLAFEGFGLVVLEAAACGTPSIVSDIGGLPEVAGPLEGSLVVPADDTDALARRIQAAARGALPSRAATRSYAKRFDWPKVAERHRKLYARLAAGKRDERTRVVFLDHVARLSGGEIALLRVLPHMRGVNAHVILGEDGPFANRLQQAGISVEVLAIDASARDLRKDSVRLGAAGLAVAPGTLAYVARLALRLRALRPDIVHTNSLKAGVYGTLAARAAGVPAIWHVRDRISEDYLPAQALPVLRRLIGRLPRGVIVNSQTTLRTLGPAPRSGAWREVLADAVLASPVARPKSEQITFGMVGRLAPWKGQDLFLRAFAAAFPDSRARAVIVGNAMFGEEDYERELPALAERLGIGERVEFRGFREDVWRELAGFDVLVHASRTPEPFGQVVLEGMAVGLPVIAPDEGGPSEMIVDRRSGHLFKSRDVDGLAAAMISLHVDPVLRENLGAGAREAAARYHPDVAAARLEALYARVAKNICG